LRKALLLLRDTDAPWYEPGVSLISDGIHRIPLPLPGERLRAVNVYLIESADGPVLIDAGWSVAEAFDTLRDAFAALHLELRDVRRTLITHMHSDHYTLAMMLRRLFGTRVDVGIGERDSIESVVRGEKTLARFLEPWGAEALSGLLGPEGDPRDEYGTPDCWIAGPTDIDLGHRTLRAIPTPGHTRGHLVFADLPGGLLFSGDHILPTITPSIGLEPARSDMCLVDFITSLETITAMPDLEVLPAHGPPGVRSHQRALELRRHHERRLKFCYQGVSAGGSTAYEVALRLPWTRHDNALAELDAFNQYLAVGETAAHLDLLVRRDALERFEHSGARLYRRVSVDEPPPTQ
jgi:glyoxylase-like metal-dependent hydrolase (beta-lactamase superfamily II)